MDSKKLTSKVYEAPGNLVYTGIEKNFTELSLISYDKEVLKRENLKSIKDLPNFNSRNTYWLRCRGLFDLENIAGICNQFDIHKLVAEDIVNTDHRPKIEKYDDYIFIISKNIYLDDQINTNQISFILKDNLLISFEERESPIFDNVERRIEEGSNIRKFSSDYLLYALLDAVVDSYFVLLEDVDLKIDELEDILLKKPSDALLDDIYNLKRSLIYVKSMIWPMRGIIETLIKNENSFMSDNYMYYYRDIYDHIIQILDLTQNARDICSGMLDTYLSSVGNKTNEIMRVLTIASTISIPLTFLTGIYGMNFKYFPSLDWKYAYPVFWLVSLIIVIIMILYFKRKKWI